MRLEVDYWDNREQTRTKIVETEDEKLIPFILKKMDRRFSKVKRIRPAKESAQVTTAQ